MTTTDGSLPSPWLRALAAAGTVLLLAGAIVLSNDRPAAATGLRAFASCRELRDHLAERVAADRPAQLAVGDRAMAADDAGSAPAATEAAAAAPGFADDGTNTQVAGVDELDVVDLLRDGRSVVARGSELWLVAADGRQVLARTPAPPDARVTVDEDRGLVWAVGSTWERTALRRIPLVGDGFGPADEWAVAGRLVDLRRAGATVHLVAVDDEVRPLEPGAAGAGDAALPFAGTSPVPCDEVLHSPLPGGPATTLVARFAAEGPLAPTAATEVVGAGDNVLVTADAVYVSTPVADSGAPVTGIHRFTADDLALTGSGTVPGRLLNQFALDEHDGHLRAAVTVGWGGRMLPVDVVVEPAVEDAVVGQAAAAATPARDEDPPAGEPEPAPATSTTEAEPTTSTTSTTEADPTTTTSSTAPSTPSTEATTTTTEVTTTTSAPELEPLPPQPDALNEIVVLDLEGDLDVVGRSARFGKPGETIHGIRFAGDVAYAVTFLQTDPFYVVDLSDPTRPAVLGQLEIPGFSAYLHPISDTEVVGFGPGPDGGVLARLFDVSQPAAPRVVDTATVGHDSPVAYDHHALRTDGTRMLLPATEWVPIGAAPGCPPMPEAQARIEALVEQLDAAYRGDRDADVAELEAAVDELHACAYPGTQPRGHVVALEPGGGQLRMTVVATGAVGDPQRALPMRDGGYLLVGTDVVVKVGPGGAVETELA